MMHLLPDWESLAPSSLQDERAAARFTLVRASRRALRIFLLLHPLFHVFHHGQGPPRAQTDETLLEQLDRLSEVIAARDAELRRLKTELELRDLYIQELHAQLRRQAERLEQLEQLVRAALGPARPPARAAGA
jgi:hypothetical protein